MTDQSGHTSVSWGVSIRTVSICRWPMLLLGVWAGLIGGGGIPPPLPPLKFCKEVNLKICSGSGRSPAAQKTKSQTNDQAPPFLLLSSLEDIILWNFINGNISKATHRSDREIQTETTGKGFRSCSFGNIQLLLLTDLFCWEKQSGICFCLWRMENNLGTRKKWQIISQTNCANETRLLFCDHMNTFIIWCPNTSEVACGLDCVVIMVVITWHFHIAAA